MSTFLVFEGIDGAGKTTQASILFEALMRKGHNVLLTREPDGTDLGEHVGDWLRRYPARSDMTELLLFCAARAEHVSQVIMPAIHQGRLVICDRYISSTLAYQGYGRGMDLEMIWEANKQATFGLEPRLTILLDVPVGTAEIRKGTENLDTFETERLSFRQRVRDGYLEMAAQAPERWLVVDGALSEDAVADRIWAGVQRSISK